LLWKDFIHASLFVMCIPILQIGPRGEMQLQTRIARIALIKKWIYSRNFICLQIDLSIKLNFSQFEFTRTWGPPAAGNF